MNHYLKLSQLSFALLLMLLAFSVSSFSLVAPDLSAERVAPPVEKKTYNKQQLRQQKRYARLEGRLKKARTKAQKQRIAKRLKRLDQQKQSNPSPAVGTAGMILSIVGLSLVILSLVGLFTAVGWAIVLAIIFGLIFAALGLGLGIAGLVMSAAGLRAVNAAPDEYGSPGISIAGIILGALSVVGFFAFLILLLSGAWII